jgi:hypothetical protein
MSTTYTFQIISRDALAYNPSTGAFELIPDYDPNVHNLVVTVTDDDDVMHNADGSDGTAVDTNQTAVITDMNGNVVAEGQIYSPTYAAVTDPDGNAIYIDRIEVDGQRFGYSTSQALTPGESYPVQMSGPYEDTHGYFENNGVEQGTVSQNNNQPDSEPAPCFVSGTLLLTRDGMMPIDWITVGDDLWTQDHGWQTVRWRGLRQFEDHANFDQPIEITPGALGPGTPSDVVRLSPQHRVLVSGPLCELWFGVAEVLVAAKHLIGRPGVAQTTLDTDHAYHHFLFDRHEILTSDGIGLGSLFLGDQVARLHPKPSRSMIRALAAGHAQTARLCLTAREARVLHQASVPAALILPDDVVAENSAHPPVAALA